MITHPNSDEDTVTVLKKWTDRIAPETVPIVSIRQETDNVKTFTMGKSFGAKPGQFVIIRLNEEGERVPLTVADSDDSSVTIVFLVVGRTTHDLSLLNKGDEISDLVGPLGRPSEMEKFGHVVVIGGGCGVAPIYPIAKKLKLLGNKVTGIIGYRNKDLIFWEEKMKTVLNDLHVATNDGSYGMKGFVFLKDKQEFVVKGNNPWQMPKGFCGWAWADIQKMVWGMARGGPKQFMTCCTDGYRPVVFKLERIE